MKLTVVMSEDGMFTSEPTTIMEIANLACSGITAAVQTAREQYSQTEEAEAIDKELFDCLNLAFSKCLENAFPQFELHPELTEEILKKEDELLKAKVAEMEAANEAATDSGV